MTASLLPWPLAKFFQPNTNLPLAGGKVYTYVAGTSTPLATYSDFAGTIPNTNPIILDANGQANIYLGSGLAYKIDVFDASNVHVPGYPVDNIIDSGSLLRADLANTANPALGDALIGVKRTLANSVATTVHAWINGQDVDPVVDFGAVGDGATDDTTAINNALAAGRWVDGKNRIFAISGNITLPATTRMRNIQFKQLTPNDPSRRTLYQLNGTVCWLDNVVVNKNGNGGGGSQGSAAGIYIDTCARCLMIDVEVYGNDKGTGILLNNCAYARLERPYVHDMTFGTSSDSAYTDDQIQGIWIIGGNWIDINSPVVKNLLGQWTAQAPFNRFTRGITISGTQYWTIADHTIENIDQGIDNSGDTNAQFFSVMGGQVTNAYSWGYKNANSPKYGSYIGCKAYKCSLGGFTCSAPNLVATYQTSDIDFIGCLAYSTGENGAWNAGSNVAAFSAFSTAAYATFPRSIRFIQCKNIGGSNTEYGFYNDVTIGAAGDIWVEQIDCNSITASIADYQGLAEGYCDKTRANNQSIPNNAWTAIVWDNTINDRMLSTNGGGGDQIYIRRSGIYTLNAIAGFAANGTGIRGARVTVNGTPIFWSTGNTPGYAGGVIHAKTSADFRVKVGDIVRVECFQDSGGALNLLANEAEFLITQQKLGTGT